MNNTSGALSVAVGVLVCLLGIAAFTSLSVVPGVLFALFFLGAFAYSRITAARRD